MAIILILILAGLALLLVETFLPGLIVGALGLFSLLAAVIYAYAEFGVESGNTTLIVVLVLLAAATGLWVKFFPNSPIARRFVSTGQVGDVGAEQPELLGAQGVALSDLRPAGMAEFGGKRADVVTEGGFVKKGQALKVVEIEGLRVVVRPVENA